jgi:hypothetical protein
LIARGLPVARNHRLLFTAFATDDNRAQVAACTPLFQVQWEGIFRRYTFRRYTLHVCREWTPDKAQPEPGDVPAGPSVFSVLQEQVGLRLGSRRVAAEVLVVDHADPPSAN